jgi:hypothetical protein
MSGGDTIVLVLNDGNEEYIPIQMLKQGDLIKTLQNF